MDLQLRDKVVLITGAAGGIGRALAETFAAEGAKLALHAHTGVEALETWLGGEPWSENAIAIAADLRVPAEIQTLFDQVEAKWGRVDACVANAALRVREPVPLADMEDDRIRRVVETNVVGALFLARGFLHSIRRTGASGTSLCLIGSTAASFGERGFSEYAASKSALTGLILSLKNEVAGIDPSGRVNLVEPGWTATHRPRADLEDPEQITRALRTMALRRVADAADVAKTVAWLSSPSARHVTGETVRVAGGMEGRLLWERDEVDAADVIRRARQNP